MSTLFTSWGTPLSAMALARSKAMEAVGSLSMAWSPSPARSRLTASSAPPVCRVSTLPVRPVMAAL